MIHPSAGSDEPAAAARFDALLPALWRGQPRITVLDGVFDAGLTFMRWWQMWQRDPQRCEHLHVISVSPEIRQGLSEHHELTDRIAGVWPAITPNFHRLSLEDGRVQWLLVPMELGAALRELVCEVDAFWLASPASHATGSPLIDQRLAKALARLAAPDAVLAVNRSRPTTDGVESRALRSAGFTGQGAHDSEWRYAPAYIPRGSAPRHGRLQPADRDPANILVIGAGLAGCAMAWALAEHGLRSTVFERQPAPALETSGNPAGLFHGIVNPQDGAHARFNRAAALEAQRAVSVALSEHGVAGSAQGLLRLEMAHADVDEMRERLARLDLPADYVQALSASEASDRCGWQVEHPAWWYPGGGWVEPGGLARSFLERAGAFCTVRTSVSVDALARVGDSWQLLDAEGRMLAQAQHVVLTNAGDALRLILPLMPRDRPAWPMHALRGQISIAQRSDIAGLRLPAVAVTGSGYVLPAQGETVIFGATSQADDPDPRVRSSDHEFNVAQLSRLCGTPLSVDVTRLAGRTGWRWSTDDRLPVLGAVPDLLACHGRSDIEQARHVPRIEGLHACTAFGSRGITWAALAAQVVAASISGAPAPIEASLLDNVDARRFVSRSSRKSG